MEIIVCTLFILLIIFGVGSLMMITEQAERLADVNLELEMFRDNFKQALVIIRKDQKETDIRVDILQREVHANYFVLKDLYNGLCADIQLLPQIITKVSKPKNTTKLTKAKQAKQKLKGSQPKVNL